MKILVAAAEAVPYHKTGGLAYVTRSLPDALQARGHDVRVIMPGYGFLDAALHGARADAELVVPWPGGAQRVSVALREEGQGAATAFVLAARHFDTADPYGGDDSALAQRFALFCRAVAAYARHWQADVVHVNDWQTGLVPLYGMIDGLDAATVFAIHNLGYQGNFPSSILPRIGVPPAFYRTENGVEFHGHASFMKAGLALADRLVTVSRTYAAEIRTPQYGLGFEGLLTFRRRELHGVLNGIDTRMWDPARDALLPLTYSPRTIARKHALRAALAQLGRIAADGVILGLISRLAHQKGIDLLLEAAPALLELGCSLVVIGHGDRHYEQALLRLAERRPDRVAVALGFDEPLAHLVYAGADFFLMPSLYEPCGLGQLIAQRYGTPPIARRTGGLNDTIQDGVTGFLFEEASAVALLATVERAREFRRHRGWRSMQLRCMREDHSWTRSAAEYERVYDLAIGALAP